ncbi:MAG: AarF/UbiB family protein [Thermomicrobiales bacterium]|nr:AarF/UbiB family protein [Thermomicrobiales bacterium]
MGGFVQFILIAVFTVVTLVAFAWVLRGLLGVAFSWPRLIIAAIITFSLFDPITSALPGLSEAEINALDGAYFPALWVIMLGMAISILVGMLFLVIAEALIPSNSIPGPMYLARATRRWMHRTRRYLEISWILFKHGISIGAISSNRSELRSSEGRAFFAGKVRDALSESGVTFIKLGQILSTRRDLLPPEFIAAFSTLQTNARPLPWSEIEQAIIADLAGKRIDEVFAEIDHTPLASASIAQVHTATLLSGEEVVLKIRRPGIRSQVEQDLDILDRLAMQVERSTAWGREMGVRALVAGFAAALKEELDLSVETRNMRIIAAGSRPGDTLIPHVYADLCTSDLLVMERMHGTPISIVDRATINGDRQALADTVFDSLLHQLLITGTFHADPHPGNIMLLDDGRLTLLDFGSVGRMDKVTRQALIRMLIAWGFADPVSATDALLIMVDEPDDLNLRQLERDMGAFMATYIVPGATVNSQVIADLFGIVARNGLSMPPSLAAALRALGTIEGTLTWLSPGYDILTEARRFAEEYMRESVRPTNIRNMLTEELVALLPVIRRMPRRLDRLTTAMEAGRFTMNVGKMGTPDDHHMVRSLVQELLLTVLAGASGLMATMLIGQDSGPMLVSTMSVFQFMGYFLLVLAFILAMRVLIFVFRRP